MKSSKGPLEYPEIFDPKTFKVEHMWLMYARAVLPRHVSQIQHDETRNAFYAGFLECFKMMSEFSSELEEDDACILFNRLSKEANEFFEEMVKQAATRS